MALETSTRKARSFAASWKKVYAGASATAMGGKKILSD
jgi:hypothetical protein